MPDTTNNDVAIARWKRGVSPPLGPRLGCRRISLGVHRRATCAIVLEARSRRQRSRELSLLTPIPVTNHKIWAEFDAIWVLAGSGQIFAGAGRNQIWTGSGSLRAGFDRIWVGLGSSWAKLGRSSASSGGGFDQIIVGSTACGPGSAYHGPRLDQIGAGSAESGLRSTKFEAWFDPARVRPELGWVPPNLFDGYSRWGAGAAEARVARNFVVEWSLRVQSTPRFTGTPVFEGPESARLRLGRRTSIRGVAKARPSEGRSEFCSEVDAAGSDSGENRRQPRRFWRWGRVVFELVAGLPRLTFELPLIPGHHGRARGVG